MSDMIEYSVAMLQAISDFLLAPPASYLFGLIMLACILSVIMMIIHPRK